MTSSLKRKARKLQSKTPGLSYAAAVNRIKEPRFLVVELPTIGKDAPPGVVAGQLPLVHRPEGLSVFCPTADDFITCISIPQEVVVPLMPLTDKELPRLQRGLIEAAQDHGEFVRVQDEYDGVLFRKGPAHGGLAVYCRIVKCNGCGVPLLPGNRTLADGCPCNSPRGINHGLVPKDTCTCSTCDPEETGSARVR